MDLSPLLGTWRKTNDGANWIDALVIRGDGDGVVASVNDWGEARSEAVYASATDASRASAFHARYALADADVDVEANANLGLLVVATFVRWRDGVRSNGFTREFFYRSDA
jgi:hypothetical protein